MLSLIVINGDAGTNGPEGGIDLNKLQALSSRVRSKVSSFRGLVDYLKRRATRQRVGVPNSTTAVAWIWAL